MTKTARHNKLGVGFFATTENSIKDFVKVLLNNLLLLYVLFYQLCPMQMYGRKGTNFIFKISVVDRSINRTLTKKDGSKDRETGKTQWYLQNKRLTAQMTSLCTTTETSATSACQDINDLQACRIPNLRDASTSLLMEVNSLHGRLASLDTILAGQAMDATFLIPAPTGDGIPLVPVATPPGAPTGAPTGVPIGALS
jgi:hypothetical protein